MNAITVNSVSKAYKQYPTRWSRLAEWMIPGNRILHKLKWVLEDINFTVNRGESIGIIGINGAGKSTLLKIITGTTQPTRGNVKISGRVAALLELGMGFHPDFTGRQNLFMAGQLLGYSAEELTSLMPEIEAFAEIGDYIDQPVRIYSSGMQVRLAFSLATAARPDILIVDEALAVGDIFFQQKCFDRISEMKKQGVTLLFVTHDMGTIYRLCDKAIYISSGKIKTFGDVRAATLAYELDLKNVNTKNIEHEHLTPSSTKDDSYSYTKAEIEFISGSIISSSNSTEILEEGAHFSIEVKINGQNISTNDTHIGFQIRDAKGNIYFETNTYCLGSRLSHDNGLYIARFELINNLQHGTYILSFGVASGGYGTASFKEINLHDVGRMKFNVIRNSKRNWAGLCGMGV